MHYIIFHPSYCYLRNRIKANGHFTYCSNTWIFHAALLQLKAIGFIFQACIYIILNFIKLRSNWLTFSLSFFFTVDILCCILLTGIIINITKKTERVSGDCDAEKLLKTIMDPNFDGEDHQTTLNILSNTQWGIIQYLKRRMNNLVQAS
ncbi:hypothetical protein HZS_10, partial [Henneguya salminicola]